MAPINIGLATQARTNTTNGKSGIGNKIDADLAAFDQNQVGFGFTASARDVALGDKGIKPTKGNLSVPGVKLTMGSQEVTADPAMGELAAVSQADVSGGQSVVAAKDQPSTMEQGDQ